MPNDLFDKYISEINKAYLRGDATEHTHRPALKVLVESITKNITAINEPKRIKCGAPDIAVSRQTKTLEQIIGYVECKDIGVNLVQAAKTEQIKKRYLPSLHNLILTDYIDFYWYLNGKKELTARLAEEQNGKFKVTRKGQEEVKDLFYTFLSQKPLKIKIAGELAAKMANKARMMRDIIEKAFKQEDKLGALHGQYEAFKEVLLHDLTEEQFADMYAQTISYGLFTARCYIDSMNIFGKDTYAVFHGMDDRPKTLTRKEAAYLLPKTNPFLRKVFGHIAGPELDDRIAWLVDDLVELLRQADMGTILRDFARQTKRKDPVIHFYETFLAEYDSKLRKSRGVYYTPEPVVSYIVRSIDWLLKEKFGLKRGLADEKKIRIKTQDGQTKELHKCLILDPAVGTGTFLHEVVNQIHDKFKRQKGMWSGYVKEHLLPRIFGFELMMAPYAVAHMKLGLQLAETGYDFESEERLGVYLTNTLEEANEISKNVFVQELSNEARAANSIKKDLPIMVITGNPPYSGLSANMNDWIDRLLKNKLPGKNGAQSYYEIDGQPLGEKKLWLQDDYVKFIRFAQHRIEQTGSGILAFITNNGYLDNPTFRGMRQSLMQTFDEIYILDLHGSTKKKETCQDGSLDKNVFDIQQGVSIGVFLKKKENDAIAEIYHADLYGLRKGKYEWLLENDIKTTVWTELSPNLPYYFFVKRDESNSKEYENFVQIGDMLPVNVTGIVTARDKFVIDFDEDVLLERIKEFRNLKISDGEIRSKYFTGKGSSKYLPGDTRSWKIADVRRKVASDKGWGKRINNMLYRPFDLRSIYYTNWMVDWPRPEVMHHMLMGKNLGLISTRMTKEKWDVFVSRNICGHKSCAAYDINSLFPLYLYPKAEKNGLFEHGEWAAGKDGRIPNLSPEYVEKLAGKVKLEFVPDGKGDLKKTFGPEDIFHYIYGVFHSPSYRKRYSEFLKIDFPRVPLTSNKKMFAKLCKVGEELVGLHLMESGKLEDDSKYPKFNVEGESEVEKGYPKYVVQADNKDKGKVHINGSQYFEGVRPEVWNFCVGGYQVCEKWLKDRRGRKLSYNDIEHYQKITVALGETITAMNAIDEIIDAHGGWPVK